MNGSKRHVLWLHYATAFVKVASITGSATSYQKLKNVYGLTIGDGATETVA